MNFQPAAAPVPPGYLADTGAVFGARSGLTFGWNADTSGATRDRNAANSADQRYDTLIHLQVAPNRTASWQIAVPNDAYRVRVVVGDPSNVNSNYGVAAEGVLVVAGTPTSAQRWFDGAANVTVSDGLLTLTSQAGATNNKIDFVEIALR